LFALKGVQALFREDLDALYTRFVVDCDDEAYWRAWWEGIRGIMPNFDYDYLRNTILSQIERTEWRKLYFYNEMPHSICAVINQVSEAVKDHTLAVRAPIPGWDFMPVVLTIRYLLRELFAHDVDDMTFRESLMNYLTRVFGYYPPLGEHRRNLAQDFFQDAINSPMESRAGDLQVLRGLLVTETHEMVTDWKKEECAHEFCRSNPSLPGLILEELAAWKKRQYDCGLQNAERPGQIQFRIQYLFNVLYFTSSVGGFVFPRHVLEGFWDSALASSEDEAAESVFWGGDYVTESIRLILFHGLSTIDINRHSGLVGYPRDFI